ncbi:MAG TPA: hypothetical protein VMR70_12530 [Flavisolibacter sp.]|nr:hypothetical protein [Flavisolibacter sp.]
MFTYQRFHVCETDHFEKAKYPQIDADLKAIAGKLGAAAGTPGGGMCFLS